MSEPTAEEGIAAIYRSYVETFNTGDGAAVAALLAYPVMVGGSGHPPICIPDAPAYQRMIEDTFRQFKAMGWIRSQIDSIETVATAGDTGIVAAHFSRYRADGSQIERGSGHYVTIKRDGAWRIVAAIVA